MSRSRHLSLHRGAGSSLRSWRAPDSSRRCRPSPAMKGEVGLGLLLRQLGTIGRPDAGRGAPRRREQRDAGGDGLGPGRAHGASSARRAATAARTRSARSCSTRSRVLRTEELLAVHRFDGAEQYFTRAVDFGYSFSVDETLREVGPAGDPRRLRPADPHDPARHRHRHAAGRHRAAGSTTRRRPSSRARRSSRPATRRSSRSRSAKGLRPWQPKKFYYTGRFGFAGEPPPPSGAKLTAVDTAGYDPLLGRVVRGDRQPRAQHHKTQGMAQLLSLPGPSSAGYQLVESAIPGLKEKGDASLFDGIDTSVPGLARYVPGEAPAALTAGLAAIADARRPRLTSAPRRAGRRPRWRRWSAGCRRCAPCGRSSRRPRSRSRTMRASKSTRRLERKERQFVDAMLAAGGIRLEALADDGLVVAGQPVKLTVIAANRGASAIAVKQIGFRGFDGEAGVCKTGTVAAGRRATAARRRSRSRSRPGSRASTGSGCRTPRATSSSRTRRSACRSGRRRSACSSISRSAAPPSPSSATCSTATRATSSAARSGWSCTWCRAWRCRVTPDVAILPAGRGTAAGARSRARAARHRHQRQQGPDRRPR